MRLNLLTVRNSLYDRQKPFHYNAVMTRILFAIAILLIPTAAQADYFFWQDPKSGLTLTYPDTWEKQNNQNPDTVLTIEGPANLAKPQCKVNVADDSRYVIFPAKYGQAVQKDAVSTEFWKSYMGLYDDYMIDSIYDGAGLGRWVASYSQGLYAKALLPRVPLHR